MNKLYSYKNFYFQENYLVEFRKIYRGLKRIVDKYEKYEVDSSSSPSAPNTSIFRASHSGSINTGVMFNRSSVSHGEVFYVDIGYNIDGKIKKKLVAELDKFISKYKSLGLYRTYEYGTNYSPYRVYWKVDDKSLELSYTQYLQIKSKDIIYIKPNQFLDKKDGKIFKYYKKKGVFYER